MMSVAMSGSASDATKTAPTVTVSHVQVNLCDESAETIFATEEVAHAGATATSYDLSNMQAAGAEFFLFRLKIAVGGGGGSSRTTNHDFDVSTKGLIGHIAGLAPQPCFIHTGFVEIAGNPNDMIGFFQTGGPNGAGGESQGMAFFRETRIAGGTTDHFATVGPTNGLSLEESVLMVDAPALDPSTDVRGSFMVPSDSIIVFDPITGIYATGPSSNMEMSVRLNA